MSTRTAKVVFYVGTLTSALLFLALTWNTHIQMQALTHADQLSDEVVAGKHVFQKYNCNDCHTILGFGAYYAPDLTRVYGRRGDAYIRAIITAPQAILATSFRKMPNLHVKPIEIDQLVAFFKWVNDIDTHDWPPQDVKYQHPPGVSQLIAGASLSPGAALFKENGCFNCHKLGGTGGEAGPALDDVGSRLNIESIKKLIVNPKSVNPNAEMPGFSSLVQGDLESLADFLSKQRGGQ